jgi:toxin-antitoxin system PIN domain toxin
MILPDVNVLIYAFRKAAPQHFECSHWLELVLAGDARYGMSPLVLSAVIRIVTNPRAFQNPDTPENAMAYANLILNQPHCEIIRPGPRHWEIFCRLCRETNTRGDLVPDAWFAALAIESGCEWITLDRDYRKFDGLRTRAPF